MRVVSGELAELTGVVVGITSDDRVEVKADLKELTDVLVLDPAELTKSFEVRGWIVHVPLRSCVIATKHHTLLSCLLFQSPCLLLHHLNLNLNPPQKGDHVKVASGPAQGQTGLVVKVQEHICWVFTDTGKEEVQVFARDLVEAAAAETTGVQSYVGR